MNAYIIVEGNETEMSVIPAWIGFLAPKMQRIEDPYAVNSNNYYIFCGHGIPSIYRHTVNAIADVNDINSFSEHKYDYILLCLDTEEGTKADILDTLKQYMDESGSVLNDVKLLVFDQKVCMESWFLGNRKVFKTNPQNADLIQFVHFYNVKQDNPEEMPNIDDERYATKAQFHFQYLRRMLAERNMIYGKNNTRAVCDEAYLQELILRYEQTGHISSFGFLYEFIKNELNK